jgi:regulator of sigma E protease
LFITIISFLFILGVLVFVHEFGHFIMAKNVGVRVETFSLGFGPKLLKKKYGDTEYCISGIPLGGYVKLKGENPDEESTGAADELMAKSIPARFSIFVAGPVMNVLLAIVLVSLVFFIGIEVDKYLDEQPAIGWIDEDSPAAMSGMQVGDVIRSVGGEVVETWEQAFLIIASAGEKALEIEVERGALSKTFTITPETENQFRAGDIGVGPVLKPVVGGLMPGYPAEKEGFQVGDEIISINDTQIVHWLQMINIVNAHPNEELRIKFLRNGQEIEKFITPQADGERSLLGIEFQQQTVLKKYGLVESFSRGVQRCWELTGLTVDLLRRLITRQASAKNIGGPIMIAQMSGQVIRQGLSRILSFMGLVSLSLGIFNLLPIPVLDGGHIFLLFVEILSRKPLSMKKRELAQKIGLLILIPLMLFVFYNDIARIFGW